jgi:hypothetical protein
VPPTEVPEPTATPPPPAQAPAAADLGAIQVETVDDAGDPVAGACYQLVLADGSDQIACGIAIGGDPVEATFSDLPDGEYRIAPVGMPDGYGLPASQSVTIAGGQAQTVTLTAPLSGPVQVEPNTATFVLVALDVATGEMALGSCFALAPVEAAIEPYVRCVAPGAGGAAPGPLSFVLPAPGAYVLTSVQLPPDTVVEPASYEIVVTPGQSYTWVSRIVPGSP